MTSVIIHEVCGNSPKNIFVRQFTIAVIAGDIKFLSKTVTDDVHWNILGGPSVQGKDQLVEMLRDQEKDPAVELSLHHIATHGKIKFKSGETQAFCNVYQFNNAKGVSLKEIFSYIIETQ